MPPKYNENLETPAFERKRNAPRTSIQMNDDTEAIGVLEPYRTVKRRMTEARTHFEVTCAANRMKMWISAFEVKMIWEIE